MSNLDNNFGTKNILVVSNSLINPKDTFFMDKVTEFKSELVISNNPNVYELDMADAMTGIKIPFYITKPSVTHNDKSVNELEQGIVDSLTYLIAKYSDLNNIITTIDNSILLHTIDDAAGDPILMDYLTKLVKDGFNVEILTK